MDEALKRIRDAKENRSFELDLSGCDLDSVPKEITELTWLTCLDLSGNSLDKFPLEVLELTSLTCLKLGAIIVGGIYSYSGWGNRIKELPKEIVELKNLTLLDLSLNQLSSLPKEIVELKNLTQLDLRNNQLSSLPKEIVELKNLTQLDLRNNQLSSLPKEIVELKNLTQLYLSYNQLSALPKEIVELKNLTQLYLSSNQLSALPKEIVEIKNLTHIYLDKNPLENPPIEIAKKGINEIRNYFKSLEQGSKKLYEAKLIIVGQGEVGKTCLTNKLKDNNWQLDSNQPSTEGIAVEKWEWNLKDNDTKKFKVNIWDFGGQEIYHSTHQFFLTKRSLYIFVWDARKEESYGSFDYWLNVVNLLSNKSPVIIVMNKADERIKEIDQASLKQKFSNIVGFYKVSCLKGIGIVELSNAIKEAITKLPHVGTEWPDVWTKIRHCLEDDGRDYIDCAEYYKICGEYGLDDEKADYLSSFLHDLGVILHFQDDDILRNIVILKPEWGTNAVYRVLDTKSIQEKKGRFTKSDLPTIWEKTTYPRQKHNELVQLMIKFEICFNLTDSNEYIVSEMLEDKRPSFDWDDKDNVQFEYQYDFMPEGIITRFIVRNHLYIENNIYWKSGAILTYENARALVVSEKLNRKIKISIDDKKLKAGDLWFEEIKQALNRTKVGVFLVSPDFLASEFIHKHELTPLLEKAEKRGVTILWVAVRPSAYKETELEKYQCANDPDKPLNALKVPQREKQYVNICEQIIKSLKK